MKKDEIKELLEIMDASGLSAIRYADDEVSIELERQAVSAMASMFGAMPAATSDEVMGTMPNSDDGTTVCSPMVGTFYAAPSPDEPPFVVVGQEVIAGQTLCIVEAMKMMNEISAPCAGIVSEVFVENGCQVEYDQPLFSIEG